ncbi:hypothetical protein OC834_000397 [Tilletia horrida]|nr:hypothetical protein OC834_000397 [Tilletia horrida]
MSSLKNSYEPLRFASLGAGSSSSSAGKQLLVFHLPDGLDPAALDGLVLDLNAASSSSSSSSGLAATFTAKQAYEIHSAPVPAGMRILAPDAGQGEEDNSLSFSSQPIAQAFNVRLSHPKYRASKAPSLSSSNSSSATSAPSTSSAPSVGRVKPQQPWDRLKGEFKPAGSNSEGPLPPLTTLPSLPLALSRGEPDQQTFDTSSHHTQKKNKKRPSSSDTNTAHAGSAADETPSPKKAKKEKAEGKDKEKKKKRKSE